MKEIATVKTTSDFQIVADLAKEIWTEHYTPIIGSQQVTYMLKKFQSAAAIQNQIENGALYYLISLRKSPTGYFSISINENFLFLSKLYVLKSARGNGLGSMALAFIEESARKHKCPKIRLTVNKYNSNSIHAYTKMGFQNIEAIVQDIGNGYVMDDYVLEKVLPR